MSQPALLETMSSSRYGRRDSQRKPWVHIRPCTGRSPTGRGSDRSGGFVNPLLHPEPRELAGSMSDEPTLSDDSVTPGPQGAPAHSDTPVHNQPTAAGQAP